MNAILHHHDARGNFGSYTLFWDRLFGTLHPGYAEHFGGIELVETHRISG